MTEDEVQEKCKDLEINTIDNVIEETPQPPVVEEVYDNVDIIQPETVNNDNNDQLLDTFLQNITDNEQEESDINQQIQESPVEIKKNTNKIRQFDTCTYKYKWSIIILFLICFEKFSYIRSPFYKARRHHWPR